ncbi:hypothetical protein E3O25_16705 [Cryobacterium sp. TMT1-3]|uniref:hypothetical protein n=1 Tax=Cryobacterium sp. TMT1-3 TaxID=1259237 RepID=UPI00106A5308|nr:hypothetical protein [Cryobacterium sp. TMT1-3]TFC24764.1 hypothetical protein E3O25_16705 [Cryobacterium sp. TMT1-3]
MFHATRPAPPVRLLALLSAGLLGCALLSGCTAGASAPTAATPASVSPVASEDSAGDIGNGRPTVSYDGLLVQRRVVLAVQTAADADAPAMRFELEERAHDAGVSLTDISPDVLPAGVLEQAVPQLTLLLPANVSEGQARALIEEMVSNSPAQYYVLTVLVHDLIFEVPSTDSPTLAEAIAREGILSDALGNYDTTLGANTLDVAYLGTLLGDEVVDSVRSAIARPAGITPKRVSVRAGTPGGPGVDVAAEPIPKPVVLADGVSHEAAGASPIATDSLPFRPWVAYGIGLATVLSVTMAFAGWSLFQRRRRLSASALEQEQPDREWP